MRFRGNGKTGFVVRFMLGTALALMVAYLGWLPWSQVPGKSQARRSLLELDFRNAQQIIQTEMGPSGRLYIRREGGFECRQPNGRFAWGGVSLRDQPGLEPMDPVEMTPTQDGRLLVLGVLRESRNLGLYVIGDGGQVHAWSLLPNMAPADIAVSPDGRVYLLALYTPRLNRVLVGADSSGGPISEAQLHLLDETGQIARSMLPREYRLHSSDEAAEEIDAFHERRIVAAPDGRLYMYSRRGGQLDRIDPDTGEVSGTHHLNWAGFPAQIRLSNLQFVDERQVVYSLVELDRHHIVSGFQSWQLDLARGASRLIHRGAEPDGAIWQAYFDPLNRRLELVDILNSGRGGSRDVEFKDLRAGDERRSLR